ncbi:DUF4214 domain-containing protein [Massilia sp.]|uniref:DUF4214 domain-containing protein n=1 Tax=Massilia sp. TaxID=1882437 RepID=UPI00352DD105
MVINLAAETSQLKIDMSEGMRVIDNGAKAMINSMTGVTESSDRATDAGARMVKQLKEEIATFGMTSQELQLYKANLNGVGGEVEALMGRLNQMRAAQSGFTDQLAASEAAATQRIRDMVAASMAEVSALNDVAAATQGVTNAQVAATSTGRSLAETMRLQALNMQGVAASMKSMQEGTAAMSSDAQRILAQYDPLGAKLRSLQSDMAILRKELGNSVDPAAIKAFQGLEDEIAKTQRLMAQAAAQASALGQSTSQLTQTQTQLIDRFRDQAATIGMSRSQLMAYQAAQLGVTEQTKDAIAKVKAHEEAIKAAAKAKEEERNQTNMMADALKLLSAGYAALKVGEFIKDSTMLAARYETLDVVMGVVGRTAGYTKTQMEAASEGVAKQGITMTESRNSVIKLVQAHVDLANASALARIAQDAAVIGNINSSEAFDRLVNGVARGNVLILRNIGINVNLQAAYAQMADSLGKSTRELTENERVQARLNAVLERGTDIAGTYEAAMDTASKQITSMQRYTEDLKTTLGEVFTETLTIGVMALTDGLKDANGQVSELSKNNQLEEWGHNLTALFVGLANAVSNVGTAMSKVGIYAAHQVAEQAINDKYKAQIEDLNKKRGFFDIGPTPGVDRLIAARNAELAEENATYVAAQAQASQGFDKFERVAEERMAARRAKQKADADERLKVDQDYAARATALLIANSNKSIEVQQAAQANLAKEVYQGTPHYRDTEGRESKPKVDQADNTRLQDRLARIQQSAAAEKQETEYLMKLDDMRHRAGEMGDAEFYENRRNNLALLAGIEISMYDEELAALRAHNNSTEGEEAKTQKAINDILDKQRAARKKYVYDELTDEEEARLREKKQYDDAVKATLNAGATAIKGLDDQIAKQREHNAEIGKTKEQVELAKQAQVEATTAQLQSDADFLRDGLAKWDLDEKSQAAYRIRLSNLDGEIERRRTLAGLYAAGADAEAIAKASTELDKFLDPTKAEKFGNTLKGSLGVAAKSMVDLTDAIKKYGVQQAAIDKARAEAAVLSKGNDEQRAKAVLDLDAINRRSTQEQLASYGNMASAAAGFFDQGSRGYKALQTASEVMHAAQLAMNLASIAPAMAAGAAQLFAQSGWGGFAGVAAMTAVVAGFGVALGGGHGSEVSAKDRQASQGTGTILGDDNAKSESLKKSLDLVEKNTYQDLAINSSMLTTLRSIDSNIASFASQLVRSTGITNPDVGSLNTNNGLATTLASGGMTVGGAALGTYLGMGSFMSSGAAIGGPLGLAAGALLGYLASKSNFVGKIATSIFGGKQSVGDSGFTLDKTSLGSLLANGVNARSYADITTSGGWFRGDSHDTKTSDLGADADQQFTAIIKSLAASITQAGQMLGVSGDDFTNQLNSFVIDIGKVSLKDLKGDELQKALESVFSKLGDQMAAYAIDGLQKFQQVGEGYLETLTRVATEYQTVDVVFQSFGKTFDAVGLASIEARDRLVQLAGGLDKFTSQGEYFLSNFFSEQEQAAALRKRIDPVLAQYGLSSAGEGAAQAFRDFAVSLDTTTEAGAQAYSTLMTIAPALKSVIDSEKSALDERKTLQDKLDELTMTSSQLHEKERAAVDASNLALYDRIAALQAEKDAASTLLGNVDSTFSVLQKVVEREKKAVQASVDAHTAAVSKLQSLSQSLRSTLDNIKSPDQQVLARAAAQSQIRAVLASVKAGSALPDADSLKDALSAVSKDSTDRFATYQDYLKDLYQTQNDIAALGDVTDDQLSVEQKALKAAQDQLDSLDEQLAKAQEQVDELKGINTNGLTLIDAMAALTSAVLAANSNPIVSATSAINGAYQSALHRAPDAAGLEWWQNAAANGAPVSEIVDGIKGSTEATLNTLYQQYLGRAPDAGGLAFWMKEYGNTMDEAEKADWLRAAQKDPGYKIPGYATGGDFGGGWRIVGENGPELEATGPARIFNASQTSDLFSRLSSPSGNNDALLAEVKALRMEVQAFRIANSAENTSIAKSSAKSADALDGAVNGGRPLLTASE